MWSSAAEAVVLRLHFWDVMEQEIFIKDVQPTNLKQLCDAVASIWTKTYEECFQHLIESML